MPLEDLERASKMLVEALRIRQSYMAMSHQNFCQTAARFLDPDREERKHGDKQTIEGKFDQLTSFICCKIQKVVLQTFNILFSCFYHFV